MPQHPSRRLSPALVAFAFLLTAAGCGDDGAEGPGGADVVGTPDVAMEDTAGGDAGPDDGSSGDAGDASEVEDAIPHEHADTAAGADADAVTAPDDGGLEDTDSDAVADDGSGTVGDTTDTTDPADTADAHVDVHADADAVGPDTEVVETCKREPGPPDAPRTVVFARPYGAGGSKSNAWGRGTLSADGTLTVADDGFEMGRGLWSRVAFTPDGEIGLVPQEDGSLGVLRVEGDGSVTVLQAAWNPGFYAEDVVVGLDGDVAWVVDGNFPGNGGGIYRVDIGCDGALGWGGRVLESKLMRELVPLPGAPGRFVAAARTVAGSEPGDDVHLLAVDESGTWTRVTGADAFGDDEAIVGGLTITSDGRYALVGDNSGFSEVPNRVAVVALDGATLSPVQVLAPLLDPLGLLASPWDHGVLVVSGYGDALIRLSYEPDGDPPFIDEGAFASSALPGAAVMVTRGAAEGLVIVSENQGLRLVRFQPEGGLTDEGLVSTGEGLNGIPGAVGVQP